MARSIDRAIDILLNFIQSPSLTAAEIQKRVKLPRPTLYRMLSALESRNLLRASGDPKRYRLGHRVLELANAWLYSFDMVEAAEPSLHQLWDASRETVVLFVVRDAGSNISARELRSPQSLSYSRGVGYSAPLGHGASGKVMLAFQPRATLDGLCRKFPAAVRAQLKKQLVGIARDGAYVAAGEVIPGAASIAAPVFGADGAVIGAVGLLGPYERMAGGRTRAKNVALVIRAASDISAAAGWSGAPCPPGWRKVKR